MNFSSDAKLSGSSILSLSIGTLRAFGNNMNGTGNLNPIGLQPAGDSFAAHFAALDDDAVHGSNVSGPNIPVATPFVMPELPTAASRLMASPGAQMPLKPAAMVPESIEADAEVGAKVGAKVDGEDVRTSQPELLTGDDRDIGNVPSLLALFAAITPPQVVESSPEVSPGPMTHTTRPRTQTPGAEILPDGAQETRLETTLETTPPATSATALLMPGQPGPTGGPSPRAEPAMPARASAAHNIAALPVTAQGTGAKAPSDTQQANAPSDTQRINMPESASTLVKSSTVINSSAGDQPASRSIPLADNTAPLPTSATRDIQNDRAKLSSPTDNAPIMDKRETAPSSTISPARQAAEPVIAQTLAAGHAIPATLSDGKSNARRGADSQTPNTDKPKTDKPKTDKPKTDKPKTNKNAAISAASLTRTASLTQMRDNLPGLNPDQAGNGHKPLTATPAATSAQPVPATPAWANALGASDAAALQQVGTAPLSGAPSASVPSAQQTSAAVPMSPNPVVYDSGFIDRIGQEIATLAKGPGSVRLQIMPENMGRIDIELQNDNGADRIRLITESENVRQTLAQSQGRLEQELRQAGNRPAEVAVELRQNNGGQNNGQGFGQNANSQLAGQNGSNAGPSQNRFADNNNESQTGLADEPSQNIRGDSTARYA